ncbi:MAG: YdhR family protein [Pseudomonadales bacterium]|nr:YdhR family protein [Pseudomonadales bacterium]
MKDMKTFVYTELQLTMPFADAPWQKINQVLLKQPGLLNKTWLAGVGNHSLGGFYVFESRETAQEFVNGYFPGEAASIGVAQTTRLYDGEITEAASRDMNSVHFGARLEMLPRAFVYTDVQLNIPFGDVPWKTMNPILKAQTGILSKTWLSALHCHNPGGLYAFDSVENAKRFALEYFPTEAKQLGGAFTTRVFDGEVVADASRELNSPFYQL